jgi:hypothetical protein
MRRFALALVLVAAVTATVVSRAEAFPQPTCFPQSCGTWQPGPVSITWSETDPMGTGDPTVCTETSVTGDSPDTNGTTVSCDDGDGSGTVSYQVLVDSTPPMGVAGTPDRPPDQNGWYNHPFSVPFGSSGDKLSGVAACSTIPYAGPDGTGLTVAGSCSDHAGNVAAATSTSFNYDATSPQVTGALADRAPDHDGWYNHPVTFAFQGTDATSGIASCSSATYSGPVDSRAAVNGACTDNAGNIGLGNQDFKYDDARPAVPDVFATPGNHRVELVWKLPPGASSVSVSRSEQGSSAAPVVVYAGTRSSVIDKGLKNGHKYRYAVTDIDDAGNTNLKAIRAIPTASSLRPFVGTAVSSPPLLSWKKIKGARYYNVQLFFGRKKVLSTWPRTPSLQLQARWHFRGKTYTLVPGHYRWYVWPGFGPLSAHDYGHRIGRSSFRMTG